MFQITAIFNRSYLNDVLLELSDSKIPGITISDVQGKGAFALTSDKADVELDENIKVEIIVADEATKESAKEAIRSNTQDVGSGAGKMWVTQVLEVERIRTGEVDEAAITPTAKVGHAIHDEFYTHEDTPSS